MEKSVNGIKLNSSYLMTWKPNPKRPTGAAYHRYEVYQQATNLDEYFSLAEARFAMADLKYDLAAGFIEVKNDDDEVIVAFAQDRPKAAPKVKATANSDEVFDDTDTLEAIDVELDKNEEEF